MDTRFFRGLNNVTDSLRLGLGWFAEANNVHVTDAGAVESRDGYTRVSTGAYTGAYSTKNFQRMYLVDGGNLKTADGVVLKSGLSAAPMFWTEVNEQVFFNNGIDSGVILPDNTVLEWRWVPPSAPQVAAVTGNLPAGVYQVRVTTSLADGRETGTSDAGEITLVEGQALQVAGLAAHSNVYIAPANSTVYQLAASNTGSSFVWNRGPEYLGRDLLNAFLDPLPSGTTVVQEWKGCIYAAQYLASEDQTVVWFTEPMGYHLFNLNSNFFIAPGRVEMLAPHDKALIVGTRSKTFAYTVKTIEELANYGVVPGQHWADDDGRLIFWTTRGACTALPFTNLTERQVSVAPGVSAGGTIVQTKGQKRYLVSIQQGGSAFNSL